MSAPLNPVIRKYIPPADLLERQRFVYKVPTISPAIRSLLSQPTWSVRSLLPPDYQKYESSTKGNHQTDSSTATTSPPVDEEITPTKLRHLLRLSALPPPSSSKEEARLLHALRTHIHFVRAIQSVPTESVSPLVTIYDESEEGIAESTITLADLEPYLALEEKVGRNGTIRRRGKIDLQNMDEQTARRERRGWWVDVWRLGQGNDERKMGNMFFVRKTQKSSPSKNKVATGGESEEGAG